MVGQLLLGLGQAAGYITPPRLPIFLTVLSTNLNVTARVSCLLISRGLTVISLSVLLSIITHPLSTLVTLLCFIFRLPLCRVLSSTISTSLSDLAAGSLHRAEDPLVIVSFLVNGIIHPFSSFLSCCGSSRSLSSVVGHLQRPEGPSLSYLGVAIVITCVSLY